MTIELLVNIQNFQIAQRTFSEICLVSRNSKYLPLKVSNTKQKKLKVNNTKNAFKAKKID